MATKKPLKPLHPDALTLLPDADDTIRCAEHTRAHDIDPGGTALDVSLLVLVETPLPWPKPVFGHDLLTGLSNMFDSPHGPARILATAPAQASEPTVHAYLRTSAGAAHLEANFDSALEMRDAIDHLASADAAQFHPAEPAVLVCTQGSHDVCCGTEGMRFAKALELSRPDVRIFHVSHTGGHKFAPTAMTIPDGRMWAHLTVDLAEQVLDRSAPTYELAGFCRGWWGATGGPQQVAERALFADVGWDWEALDRTVTELAAGDEHWIYRVTGGDHDRDVAISVRRHVPTITCRADGGLPAKPAKEYVATLL